MSTVFIDGDFDSWRGTCQHHCSPTCHPAQVGPEWLYGCRHPAWPANRAHDFVPIVECGGDVDKCDMKGRKFVSHYKRGLSARIRNALKKADAAKKALREIEELTKGEEQT